MYNKKWINTILQILLLTLTAIVNAIPLKSVVLTSSSSSSNNVDDIFHRSKLESLDHPRASASASASQQGDDSLGFDREGHHRSQKSLMTSGAGASPAAADHSEGTEGGQRVESWDAVANYNGDVGGSGSFKLNVARRSPLIDSLATSGNNEDLIKFAPDLLSQAGNSPGSSDAIASSELSAVPSSCSDAPPAAQVNDNGSGFLGED